MCERTIVFNKVEDMLQLTTVAEMCDFGIDIGKSINTAYDAKSILGIMNLGLHNPLKLYYNGKSKLLDGYIERHSPVK